MEEARIQDEVLVERHGGIYTVIINRPEKRNSLNPYILGRLEELFTEWEQDADVRVVVIRGGGDRVFSAGFDIGQISPGKSRAGNLEATFQQIRSFKCPVIAMISGPAVGAGLDLAINCDFRIASEDAKLGITPAKLGLVYHPKGLKRFVDTLGIPATKMLFLTGALFPAAEALRMGVVDRVVPPDQLEEATYQLAGELAENAPLALRGLKMVINTLMAEPRLSYNEAEKLAAAIAEARASEDLLEGKRAFAEKRKPVFRGR